MTIRTSAAQLAGRSRTHILWTISLTLILPLLCGCRKTDPASPATATPAARSSEEAEAFIKARRALLESKDSTELVEAVGVVAELGREEAPGLLETFFCSSERVAALDVSKPLDSHRFHMQLRQALFRLGASGAPFAEKFLVLTLTESPAFGSWTNGRQQNGWRMEALGHLKAPGKPTYDLLRKAVMFHFGNNWKRYPAEGTLAMIGTDEAKRILWEYYHWRCEKPWLKDIKKDETFVPMTLQYYRHKPAVFEAMVEFYRRYGDREKAKYLVDGMVAGKRAAGERKDRGWVPGYDSVRPGDAGRFLKAIDSLLENPGKGRPTERQRAQLKELRATLAKKQDEER